MNSNIKICLIRDILDELAIFKTDPQAVNQAFAIGNIKNYLKDFELKEHTETDVLIFTLKLLVFDSGLQNVKKGFALSTIAEMALSTLHELNI